MQKKAYTKQRVSIVLSGLVAILLPIQSYAQNEQTYASALFEPFVLENQAVELTLGDATIYVPANTLHSATRIRIRDRGSVSTNGFSSLPKHYRSNATVYTYFFEGDFSADAATIELNYNPGAKEGNAKTIFFQSLSEENPTWEKLDTIAYPAEDTIRAQLPEASGRIVFARHRYKKEQPTKSTTFSSYAGVPYSDTAAVIDMKSGAFLFKQEASKQRAIASISKIATSLVFLESNPELEVTVTYSSENDQDGASVNVANGDQLRLRDVLFAALVPSANNMAATLSVSAGISQNAFMERVNAKMDELGLRNTAFVEPTGLNPGNISTAGNIAKLARYAFTKFDDVYQEAESYASYTFSVQNTGRSITVYSTNKFDGRGKYEAVAFKTGYLPPYADRTLVIQIRDIATGHEIVVSLLGNPEYNTIFDEAYYLADWTFTNWEFQNYD